MRISKEYKRNNFWDSFFHSVNYADFFCLEFTEAFLRRKTDSLEIKVALSTKNPKKKGFRKVIRNSYLRVKLDDRVFGTLGEQQLFLNKIGVEVGDSFWLKVKEVKH